MSYPEIKPIKLKTYNLKQSKYPNVGALPTRALILGPSGSGKSVLLTNFILDIYRDCFSRVYIFSPSINVDSTWLPVKKYIEDEMKTKPTKEEPLFYDHYDAEDLERIIDNQHQVIEYMKTKDYKKLFQILIVIDDFADNSSFSRHSKLLHSLFTRGRHNAISTLVSSQKATALSPIIRVNATQLYIYRLRNQQDLETILTELSAIYDKKTILELYNLATDEPYSFLYVNLMAHDRKNMFFKTFKSCLRVE